jgi:tetratricopeptide (TPR) repeat protein
MSRQKNQRRLAPVRLVSGKGTKQSTQSLRASAHRKAKQGDYTAAIALFTQLISRNPSSAADYNNRGLIYFQTGQREKAFADYNRALQINPELDYATTIALITTHLLDNWQKRLPTTSRL